MAYPLEAQLDEHGNRLPPGTFLLIKPGQDAPSSQRIVLEPQPDSNPNNPLNWAPWRKAWNFGLVWANTVVIFTNLSIQVNFWQLMGPDMGVSQTTLNNAVSVNFVGLAVGCIFCIPFTKKYGRRSTYVLATAVMAMTTWWSAKMKTATELYLTNLISGLAGATNESIALMTVADLFFVHQRGTMNAFYLSAVMLGSFLTLVPAGVQAVNQGWRVSYLTLAAFNTLLFVLYVVSFEETKYTPSVEGLAREVSLNDSTTTSLKQDNKTSTNGTAIETSATADVEGNTTTATTEHLFFSVGDKYVDPTIPMRSFRQRLQWSTPTDDSLWKLFYTPGIILTRLPHVIFAGLQWAQGVVWLTLLATIISIVFSDAPYNMNAAQLGYLGIPPMIGNLVGSLYSGIVGDRAVVWLAKRNKGYFEPEFRLYTLIPSIIAQAVGLIIFGYYLQQGAHWIKPSIGSLLFGFGLGSISDASLTMVMDCYFEMTGPSMVAITFVRNAVSIALPFSISPWMAAMNLRNMFILSGSVSFFVSGTSLLFVLFGKRIRVKLAPQYYALLERESRL